MLGVLAAAWLFLAAAALIGSADAARHKPAEAEAEVGGEAWSSFDDQTPVLLEGPWGRLSARTIMIAPSLAAESDRNRPIRWVFDGMTRQAFADFCAGLDLTDRQFKALVSAMRISSGDRSIVVEPEAGFVRSLPVETRARIYHRLSESARNIDHINAYRCWSPTPEEWLRGAGLREHTRELVEPLMYRNGDFLFFADLPSVLPRIDESAERERLRWALARERTIMLRLHVEAGESIDGLVAYWGAGGREADVRPLLRAAANGRDGGAIDVRRLLPPFAADRLYTYPADEEDLPAGDSRDCHWSALNFFNAEPDDRLANIAHVEETLERAYHEVRSPRLGDLVIFESNDEIFHSATYIAADIVMTKNGTRRSRPWMLLPLDAMMHFYPRGAPINVRYLRRQRSVDRPVPGREARAPAPSGRSSSRSSPSCPNPDSQSPQTDSLSPLARLDRGARPGGIRHDAGISNRKG